MLSNYHTLRCIASTLDSMMRGNLIREIYSQTRNELIISFQGRAEALLFSCKPEGNFCYLHTSARRARANSADVLPEAWGKTIGSVHIHPADRIITLTFTAGESLVLEFFGSRANALFVNALGIVRDTFKHARTLVGKRYISPADDQGDTLARFQVNLAENLTATATSLLKSSFPTLGSTLVREVLYRGGIAPTSRAEELTPAAVDGLLVTVRSLLQELTHPEPRVYFPLQQGPAVFSLIPLHHMREAEELRFDDIHRALRTAVTRQHMRTALGQAIVAVRAPVRHQIEKIRRTLKAMKEDARESERADEYERFGALLLSDSNVAQRGRHTVTFQADGRTVAIPLDPALSVVQNAQRYFDRAKRSRLAARETVTRSATLQRRLERAETLLVRLEPVRTEQELNTYMVHNMQDLEDLGIGPRSRARAELPFRVFSVDGGFNVWAGKSSTNNDLLTLKHAKPNDLWFHARGASGSHVILKVASANGEPSKKAKHQAASIAAYYSKMKNASTVPVAMTERKYVRKPKGASPGTVVLEREKVLFVEPRLPSGEQP